MTKLFIIIILLFIEIIGFSQNNLTGTIISSKGTQPLSFVNVYITDLKIGAVTGSDGKYSLSNIPTGTYLVEARLIGYAVRTEKVVIEGNVQLDFDLTESSSLLQEVVVTGNSIGSEILSTPVPITEVPNSYLQQNASTNIIDALSKFQVSPESLTDRVSQNPLFVVWDITVLSLSTTVFVRKVNNGATNLA